MLSSEAVEKIRYAELSSLSQNCCIDLQINRKLL